MKLQYEDIEIILGNSNKRFSGITSSLLQILPEQLKIIPSIVLGNHNLPPNVPSINFFNLIKLCKTPLKNKKIRIFHARRNDEMIQALIAKYIFKAKIKIIFTSTAQRYHTLFTRFLMSKMDGIITTSSKTNSYLKKPANVIIHHGINPDNFNCNISKEDAWNSFNLPGKIGIGIFGRVRKSKGTDVLIKSCIPLLKSNPSITLIICGEITKNNQLFKKKLDFLINENKVNKQVVFLGEIPFNRVPILFRAMNIVTALSRQEGFGLTVLEAMATGVPVVSSYAGAWLDIIKNDVYGYCVPIGNVKKTREAIEKILKKSPKELKKMGELAKEEILNKYTSQKEVQNICDYYRKVQQSSI